MGGPWKRKPQIGSAQAHGADDNGRLPEPGRCPGRALAFVPAVWSFLAPAPEPGLEPGPVPTFSVVIRSYQAAATVGHAIESALSQTVPPLEVIVVDDGSTDGTETVLAGYSDDLEIVRQENAGASAAMNAAANVAKGDFVAILDADDAYRPGRIEALGALARARPDLDILVTDAQFDLDGTLVGRFCEGTPFATEGQRGEILRRCFVIAPAVRRTTFLAAGGFDESISTGHDWDAWIRLIFDGAGAGLVDDPLYVYSIVPGSLSSARALTLRERVKILERAEKLDLSPEERRIQADSIAYHGRRALLAEADDALRRGDDAARQRSLAVAFGPGFGPVTRLKAFGAALAPRAAGRRLENLEAKTGWSRLQRGHPRG
jgi:Glycosyl transferase family 2